MGWIHLIEENEGLALEIETSLLEIDPKLEFVRHATSTEFLSWMDKLREQDPDVLASLPKDRFLGLVTAIETWKFRDIKLIGKFKSLFVQNKLAENEDDIFIVFTGYETPGFQKKRFEYRSVHNILFKPFDKLLLKQMLAIAVTGRKKTKTHFTHVQKTIATVEMLKEIELSQIGELSFKTKSDQNIKVGTVAKYYAEFFETKQHRSSLAQVISVDTESVHLRFFALDQTQSFNIQRLAQEHKQRRTLDGEKAEPTHYSFVFLNHESSSMVADLQPSFERFYDHSVTRVETLELLHKHLETEPAQKTFVFIDRAHISGNESAELDALHKIWPTIGLFVLSSTIMPEAIETELSSRAEDIFYAPFNRSYIVKGFKIRYPDLANKEDLFENVHDVEQLIHVSNPVQLVEVSESGLIIQYRRELPVGSFREFVFWLPDEIEVPTLLAQCNYVEKSQDGKTFDCHFVFFGIVEHELKFIRRWMLLRYVDEKQKGN